MDEVVQRAVALVTEQDRAAVEQFFEFATWTAGEVSSWEEFTERLEQSSVDGRLRQEFLGGVDRQISDTSELIDGFAKHRPTELLEAYDQANTGGAAGDGGAEPDLVGFAAFLSANEHKWQATWPESRKWMVHAATERGFAAESAAFVEYVEATSLNDALAAFGATPAAAAGNEGGEPDFAGFAAFLSANESDWQATWPDSGEWMVYTAGERGFAAESAAFVEYVDSTSLADALSAYGATPSATPAADEEAPTPEQAAADAMALGRRAVDALREQVPDLVVTDEQLIAILDRELNAAAQGR